MCRDSSDQLLSPNRDSTRVRLTGRAGVIRAMVALMLIAPAIDGRAKRFSNLSASEQKQPQINCFRFLQRPRR